VIASITHSCDLRGNELQTLCVISFASFSFCNWYYLMIEPDTRLRWNDAFDMKPTGFQPFRNYTFVLKPIVEKNIFKKNPFHPLMKKK
jgi:hypothetical protein